MIVSIAALTGVMRAIILAGIEPYRGEISKNPHPDNLSSGDSTLVLFLRNRSHRAVIAFER